MEEFVMKKTMLVLWLALFLSVALLAGCAPTEVVTEKIVEQTVVVEKEVEVEVEVEKEVVVTEIVEVEVTLEPEALVVGPTPEATDLAEYVPPTTGLIEEIQERGVLKVGIECAVPPAEFFDPDTGECIGFDIDLGRRLAARLGVEYEYVDTAWSGVIPSLYTKEFDLIWSMMTIREDRKKAVTFAQPYGCDQVQWIVLKGDDRFQSVEDLNGMVIATQLNSAAEAQAMELQAEGIEFAELKSFDHFDGAYLALRTGEADIVTSTAWNNAELFKAQPGIFDVGLYFPIYNYVGVANRKQDADLSKEISDMLYEMEASGALADLQYKWYGYAFACGEEGPNPPGGWTPPKDAAE
jgi:polar amino acid transport system substrate-binding protein